MQTKMEAGIQFFGCLIGAEAQNMIKLLFRNEEL